ncbi:MAG: hypothetical protein ACRDCD_02110 [Mycoplasmoidaceae bacterium]
MSKFFKFITNNERRLDLSKMGLTSNDVIILNLKKSIYELLDDKIELDLIKQSATTNKTVIVIVKENFPTEMGSIENLDDVKAKHKKIKKIFKKNENVLFFFGNVSESESIYGIEDGDITMSDPNFFDNFILEKKAKAEHELMIQNQKLEENKLILENQIKKEKDEIENEINNFDKEKDEIKSLYENSPNGTFINQNTKRNNDIENNSEGILSNLYNEDGKLVDITNLYNEEGILVDVNDIYDNDGKLIYSSNLYSEDGKLFELTNLYNKDGTPIINESSPYGNGKLVKNEFDKEFEKLHKIDSNEISYPLLDSKEYLLKSIYDYIWRMFILNNNNLLLNDLLYLSVNNFPTLSYGQNEYIRELADNVDSLFDLILKLDYKLEFNNKLFYIYLANLFTVINGKCKVNREFLVDMAIWVSDDAREQFVSRTENFMNNNLVSIEKIIYSHFIEFSTLAQSSIPRIKGSLRNEDVHLVLYKKVQYSNNRNLFSIIIRNLYRASGEIGLNLEDYILNEEAINNLDSQLKMDLADSYNILLEEVRNFIILRGSNEEKISKLYNILMSIGIEMIIEESTQVINVASLVNQEQVQIEDKYFKYINEVEPKNEIINIKYEEIEALYREASDAEKARNINEDKGNFDLDFLKDQIKKRRANEFDRDYGLNSELEFGNINIDSDEMSDKIDDYETKIRANIKMIEDQRKMLKERMDKYSNRSAMDEVIKMK